MELKNKTILFLGDSITEGYCATNNYGFAEIMEQLFELKKAGNYGIAGTRIARQRTPSAQPQFDQDFCGRYRDMQPDADIIVVFGGTNDHGHGDAPLGCFGDRTPDTFYGACQVLFSGLKERYPNALILVLTPLHRVDEYNPKVPGGWILKDYVNALRETAQASCLPVLDLFNTSSINSRLSELTTDGLHPNDEGHRVLAQEIGDYLMKM